MKSPRQIRRALFRPASAGWQKWEQDEARLWRETGGAADLSELKPEAGALVAVPVRRAFRSPSGCQPKIRLCSETSSSPSLNYGDWPAARGKRPPFPGKRWLARAARLCSMRWFYLQILRRATGMVR